MPDQLIEPQENDNKDRLIILHAVITAVIHINQATKLITKKPRNFIVTVLRIYVRDLPKEPKI
jgi:hypothetical protein